MLLQRKEKALKIIVIEIFSEFSLLAGVLEINPREN